MTETRRMLIVGGLILTGVLAVVSFIYVGHKAAEERKNDFKIACIKEGKNIVMGQCIGKSKK